MKRHRYVIDSGDALWYAYKDRRIGSGLILFLVHPDLDYTTSTSSEKPTVPSSYVYVPAPMRTRKGGDEAKAGDL
jgi:hypothetical protein